MVHDRAKMEELYSPSLDIWFEDGLDTPGIALLQVTPVESEFWEPEEARSRWRPAQLKALVTRTRPTTPCATSRSSADAAASSAVSASERQVCTASATETG